MQVTPWYDLLTMELNMKSSQVPAFPKGTLVRPKSTIIAWRQCTPEERQAWYDRHHADVRAGRDTWHDDAGESRLAPKDIFLKLTPEMTLTVLRGRVSAPLAYGKSPGACQVFCPDNGQTLYVDRGELIDRW